LVPESEWLLVVLDRVAGAKIAERWRLFGPECDERRRRLWAASEAGTHGLGGVALLARVTGLAGETIRRGLGELEGGERLGRGRVRRSGGGRRPVVEMDLSVVKDLDRVIDPATRGDPESPLRWTSKSLAKLRDALVEMGREISERTLGKLLKAQGFRLQANQKTREGSQHPDRDRQFERINETVKAALAQGQPVIGIDSKKKELVGDYKAVGREWEPGGEPVQVQGHDFPGPEVPKAVPYGVYDIANNEGYVSVGLSAETAQFSVASIQAWWQQLGRERFPNAKTLTITADCGGGNSPRVHLWKVELQRLADETGLELELCHFPPGTSKWNKIEHRLFSFISPQLARPAADQLPGDPRPDRLDDHQHRTEGLCPPGPDRLHQGQGHQRPDRRRQHHRPRLAPRVELPHHSCQPLAVTGSTVIDPRALSAPISRY
jgi:Rhodopirellula transposase DDE domain